MNKRELLTCRTCKEQIIKWINPKTATSTASAHQKCFNSVELTPIPGDLYSVCPGGINSSSKGKHCCLWADMAAGSGTSSNYATGYCAMLKAKYMF